MKKILLIISLLMPINILAYENDYFSIEIPEGYKELVEDNYNYTWVSNNENELPSIVVTVVKNVQSNIQNVEDFNDEDLLKYKTTIKETLDEGLKEYNIEVDVNNLVIDEINKQKVLTYKTIWPTKESFGYDLHQNSYVFTKQHYIITLIYGATNEEELSSDAFKTIMKSFKINDTAIKKEGFFENRRNQIIVVGCAAGIIGYIISALTKRKAK